MTNEHVDEQIALIAAELREEFGGRTSLSTEFLQQGDLATLPTQGLRDGAQALVTDGRKSAEGAGSGTGVVAYFDVATASWLTFSSDAAVTT